LKDLSQMVLTGTICIQKGETPTKKIAKKTGVKLAILNECKMKLHKVLGVYGP